MYRNTLQFDERLREPDTPLVPDAVRSKQGGHAKQAGCNILPANRIIRAACQPPRIITQSWEINMFRNWLYQTVKTERKKAPQLKEDEDDVAETNRELLRRAKRESRGDGDLGTRPWTMHREIL